MPMIVLGAVCEMSHINLSTPDEVGTLIIPTF